MLLWIRLPCREGMRRKDVWMVHLFTPEDTLFQTNDWICLLPKLSSVWAWNFSKVVNKIGAGIWRMQLDLGLFVCFGFFSLGQVGTHNFLQLILVCGCHRWAPLEWAWCWCCTVHPNPGPPSPQGTLQSYLCKWQEPICDSLGDVCSVSESRAW